MRVVLILLVAAVLCSCKNNRVSTMDTAVVLESKATPVLIDFFEVSKESFEKYKTNAYSWFISKDGQSKLYIVPYTDYSLTRAILTNDTPMDTNLVEMLNWEGIEFENESKAVRVNQIISKKGVKLGLSLAEVRSIYGKPESESQLDDGTRAIWSFEMSEKESDYLDGGLRPFVVEGLEFRSEMIFDSNDILTNVLFEYEVP